MSAKIIAISVGRSGPLFYGRDGEPKESIASAIRKAVVSDQEQPNPITVRPLGLEGDEHADLTVHGGLDKAVYLYPSEHYSFWSTITHQGKKLPGPPPALPWGQLGENLSISGITEKEIWIGDQLQIGTVRLRVESPRNPCFKFNAHMGFKHAAKMMVQSGYCGFYCSVVQPGTFAAGDLIDISRGDKVLTIEQQFALNNRTRQQDLF